MDKVHEDLSEDTTGNVLFHLIDRFAVSLITDPGVNGEPLKATSVASYLGAAKNWLLKQYPVSRSIEYRLLEIQRLVDSHCVKRTDIQERKQALGCTKKLLGTMATALYSMGASEVDYYDGALLTPMWHLMGRSSDMTLLHKSHLTVLLGGILFIRVGRFKTRNEQGTSLFRDRENFATCPIQAHPTKGILPHVFRRCSENEGVLIDKYKNGITLTQFLNGVRDAIDGVRAVVRDETTKKPNAPVKRSTGVQSHINRLLPRLNKYLSEPKPKPSSNALRDQPDQSNYDPTDFAIPPGVTSRSFRQGSAQHANGSPEISPSWIIGKYLSGWGVQQHALLPNLASIQGDALPRVRFRSLCCTPHPLRYFPNFCSSLVKLRI